MSATARRTSWISLCSSRSLRGANIDGPCCLLEHSSPLWSKIIGLPTKSIRSYPNNIQPNSKHISSETTNLLAWAKEPPPSTRFSGNGVYQALGSGNHVIRVDLDLLNFSCACGQPCSS